jgi:acetyl-CoA carboxylase carboxyl transferase subunit beta
MASPPKPPAQSKPPQPNAGWLSRIAPGVRGLMRGGKKPETPDNLWVKDPGTGDMIFRADLERALWVAPSGRHMRIGPKVRFEVTFDDGKYERLPLPSAPEDPLGFVDDRPYKDRLAAARKATGCPDAMAIAAGRIRGVPAVALVQDFSFMGGSLGMAAGEGFIAAARAAVQREAPLVAFTASGGARMQEGTLSLMQMARTTLAIQELKAARLPYVVVQTDPTTGGVLASYAMLGDVHLAEPGATLGFSGRRVIEQTIRETLPKEFQTSEFLEERGMVDRVVHRKDLPGVLGSVLSVLMAGRALKPA